MKARDTVPGVPGYTQTQFRFSSTESYMVQLSCAMIQLVHVFQLPAGEGQLHIHGNKVASFPGAEEWEEKEHLVYTVCTCAQSPQNSVVTVFVRVRMYTGDIINSLH